MSNSDFVSMREFWAQYFELTTRAAPPARTPAAVKRFIDSVFGELTEHHFSDLNTLPFRVVCSGCRNNMVERRGAVCETHLGILKGTFQAMTHVPIDLRFDAEAGGPCRIEARLARDAAGKECVVYASRESHVRLADGGATKWIDDFRCGQRIQLDPATFAVLALLDTEQTPESLALATSLDISYVRALLDHAYARSWVHCRFAGVGDQAS